MGALMLPVMAAFFWGGSPRSSPDLPYDKLREAMVAEQLVQRGIRDPKTLAAFRKIPRHLFIPEEFRDHAYNDGPVPIGHDQTISQPYIVAFMTEQLHVKPADKILEIGTGSGYQAAILGELVQSVYTIEIVEELAQSAEKLLRDLNATNIHVKAGDGYKGWPEHAPFDGVIVTAAPDHVPTPLVEQLKVGGRLVIPVGRWYQDLRIFEKTVKGLKELENVPVRFVPMTGEAMKKK